MTWMKREVIEWSLQGSLAAVCNTTEDGDIGGPYLGGKLVSTQVNKVDADGNVIGKEWRWLFGSDFTDPDEDNKLDLATFRKATECLCDEH